MYHCVKCNKVFRWSGDYDIGKINKLPSINPEITKICECGGEIKSGGPKKFVSIGFKNNPRLSWALGCNENQLSEMAKRHPGAEFVKAKSGGYQLLIKNRTDKKRRMKEAGMEEYT